jgi:hypothetical protein
MLQESRAYRVDYRSETVAITKDAARSLQVPAHCLWTAKKKCTRKDAARSLQVPASVLPLDRLKKMMKKGRGALAAGTFIAS